MQQNWARYVRRRWEKNTLQAVRDEWNLTEGEARNLIYGHVSLNVIDKIGRHKNGGLRLELDMLMNRWETTLTAYADRLEKERELERLDREACERSERIALSRLAGREDQAEAVAAPPGGAP